MLFRLFYDAALAQASYLIGCNRTGEALVVDPNRDIEQYVKAAAAEGLRIAHVTETHIHADFVSGSRELAHRTGARLYLSGHGGLDWTYGYARDAAAVVLKDGDAFHVGKVRIDVLHTPGHTPEHVVFLVTDAAATDQPMGMLTGDFVFAGDVGRPDLLERAAKARDTMEPAARALFRSLARLRSFPDHLQLWPGHGAGSACGKALGAVPQTTLGYERIANWAFQIHDETEFVREVLAGQPDPPRYFAEMKRINREGPRLLRGPLRPERIVPAQIGSLVRSGALVIDSRPAADFANRHLAGSLNIPLDRSFPTWAGWLLPYDRELYLVIDEGCEDCLEHAARDLALIGLDRIAGHVEFGPDVLAAWRAAGGALSTTPQITVDELAERLARDDIAVVDVRWESEWVAGHVPGVPSVPLGYLEERLSEVPHTGTVVLHCQTGRRSAMAASLLQALGWSNVVNLAGGFAAWQAASYPVETAGRPAPVSAP